MISRARLTSTLLAAVGLATAASALPAEGDEKKDVRPSSIECVSKPGTGQLAYPFSVRGVQSAYSLTKDAGIDQSDVRVLVIDNGFVGYDVNGQYGSHFPKRYFREDSNKRPVTEWMDTPGPEVPSDKLQAWGHGTHVVGVVLGGAMEEEPPIPFPQVRDLFRESDIYSWIKLYVVAIGSSDLQLERFDSLNSIIDGPDLKGKSQDIVNMSVIKHYSTDQSYSLPTFKNTPLIVAAAGNASDDLADPLPRYPAKAEANNLLVVASHDAETPLNISKRQFQGAGLSAFSNYGSEYVELAAPGCKIRSWPRGDGEPMALSGTSFAAPIVSFAAALLRSLFDQYDGNALGLKNRLLSSSRYSEALFNCKRRKDVMPPVSTLIDKSNGCVRFGSQLDIETALLAHTDVVEYCAVMHGESCDEVRRVTGLVQEVPESVQECMGTLIMSPFRLEGSGLSLNSAIRVVGPGVAQVLFTRTQASSLEAKQCAMPAGETVRIYGAKDLADPLRKFDAPLTLDSRQIIRVVMRSVK